MKAAALKILRYGQGVLGLKRNDIILASFPKSGNTWIRFFFCNLISLLEWDGKEVDFKAVDATMPELGADNLLRPWPYRNVPRIVKTHQRYWRVFGGNEKKIYVIRDPRDVMVSYYHMTTAMKESGFAAPFGDFIRHEKFGLAAWMEHYQSWIPHASIVLRYEDLRKGDMREFENLSEILGIGAAKDLIAEAVRRSSFENVRRVESKFGSPKAEKYKEGFRFARSGKTGGWRGYFGLEDLQYYEDLKAAYRISLY